MSKKHFFLRGLVVLIAIMTVLALLPVAASATITSGALLSGSVRLNGQFLTAQDDAKVSAFILGVDGEWSKEVEIFWGESRYVQILIPKDTGTGPRNGGLTGDIIHFKVVINGVTYIDPTTAAWLQAEQIWHNINVTTGDASDLTITTGSLAAGKVGVAYGQTMAATGGMPPYTWSWTAGAGGPPPGLDLSAAGIIEGTPTATGAFSVTVMVTDVFNVSTSKNFTLNVGSGLAITTSSLAGGAVGVAYSQTVVANGGTPSYQWNWAGNGNGLPSGLAINQTSGLISGMPTSAGTFPLIITVKDALNITANKNFDLTISMTNLIITTTELPRWVTEVWPANSLPPGWIIGQPYTANMTASGGVGAYHWSAANLPPGLSISDAGVITGTPTAAGEFDIVFVVKDSANPQNSASKILKLKIYLKGDANGDGDVSIGDIPYTNNAILGLVPGTAGCDAKIDGKMDVADITEIERIVLHLV